MHEECLAFCTCPDRTHAARIARILVETGQAACVNQLPGITSTYRWQGAVVNETEVLLLIKTVRGQLPALRATLAREHPYEVPELITVAIDGGLPAYLAWLREASGPAAS